MNYWKQVSLLFVSLLPAALGLSAAQSAEAPAAPVKRAEVLPLINFGALPKAYAFGSWSGNLSLNPDGVTVLNTANGKGGLGGDTPLSLEDATYLELQLIVGDKNQVPQVQIQFEDNNGTVVNWNLVIGQIAPNQSLWFRVPIAGMQLSQAGTDGVMNLVKIVKWRFQGDNLTESPIHLKVLSLVARR